MLRRVFCQLDGLWTARRAHRRDLNYFKTDRQRCPYADSLDPTVQKHDRVSVVGMSCVQHELRHQPRQKSKLMHGADGGKCELHIRCSLP